MAVGVAEVNASSPACPFHFTLDGDLGIRQAETPGSEFLLFDRERGVLGAMTAVRWDRPTGGGHRHKRSVPEKKQQDALARDVKGAEAVAGCDHGESEEHLVKIPA